MRCHEDTVCIVIVKVVDKNKIADIDVVAFIEL